jgi:hypothetical protein
MTLIVVTAQEERIRLQAMARKCPRVCIALPNSKLRPYIVANYALARRGFVPRCARNSVGDWPKTRLNIRLN